MPYLLALDQGTTSSRAIVFDHTGHVVAVARKELTQIFPRAGWVEHDPREIWASQLGVAVEALERAGLRPRDVAALGITNQRETTIVWDRETGEPVYNAIVWQDRRTAEACEALKRNGTSTLIQERTGLLADAYFSASKVQWILTHVPDARARAHGRRLAFGTVDSWLVWKLTDGRHHLTDVSNASRTMLFNIHTGTWDGDLLDLFQVPKTMLPDVRSSSEIYGAVTASPGLRDIPIAAVAGDQQAALFGQMCRKPGMAKNTYGTGCFLLQNVGTKPRASRNRLLSTVAWCVGDRTEFALEGSVFIGGAVVQWLRDGLGIIRSAADIEALAMSVPDSGGIVFVPAFAGLGAPHWDPFARGTIVGLTRGTRAAHLARAALESIALQVADLLDAMAADSGTTTTELRVDGGAAANDMLMQLQADVLQAAVVRPKVTEITALGAAYLAGLAAGVWSSADALEDQWQMERRFTPRMSQVDAQTLRSRWGEAVERAKDWERR